MNDPVLMGIRHGAGNFHDQLGRPPASQGSVLDLGREVAPFDETHREERLTLVFPDLEDRHDALVIELRGRLGLLAEPPQLLLVARSPASIILTATGRPRLF